MDSFFGIGIGELFVIAIIALIVLGPERLPGALRELSKWMRTFRGFTNELTSQFSEEMKALDDINPHKILRELSGEPVEDSTKKLAGTTAAAGAAKPAAKAAATTKPVTLKPATAAKPATATKPVTPKPAAGTTPTKPAKPAASETPAAPAPSEENVIMPPSAAASGAGVTAEPGITEELSTVTPAGETDLAQPNDTRPRQTATSAAESSLPAEPLPVATHPAVSVNGASESQGEA